jgi:hypothetical protein
LRWPTSMTCTASGPRNFRLTNWPPGKHRHDCLMTFSSRKQDDRSYVRQRANPISRSAMRKFWFGVRDGSIRFLVVLGRIISEKLFLFALCVSILDEVAFRLWKTPLCLRFCILQNQKRFIYAILLVFNHVVYLRILVLFLNLPYN